VGDQQIRNNEYSGATSELACGLVLTHLVILPGEYASDSLKFCVRNPNCALSLRSLRPGPLGPMVAARNADLRIDVPEYRVYEDGEFVEESQKIEHP
jgi:uncharacterized protein YcsI (UPF0317 family)